MPLGKKETREDLYREFFDTEANAIDYIETAFEDGFNPAYEGADRKLYIDALNQAEKRDFWDLVQIMREEIKTWKESDLEGLDIVEKAIVNSIQNGIEVSTEPLEDIKIDDKITYSDRLPYSDKVISTISQILRDNRYPGFEVKEEDGKVKIKGKLLGIDSALSLLRKHGFNFSKLNHNTLILNEDKIMNEAYSKRYPDIEDELETYRGIPLQGIHVDVQGYRYDDWHPQIEWRIMDPKNPEEEHPDLWDDWSCDLDSVKAVIDDYLDKRKLEESKMSKIYEAYVITNPKSALKIIQNQPCYGKNYCIKGQNNLNELPKNTVVEIKGVNRYYPEVKHTYLKINNNSWRHSYGDEEKVYWDHIVNDDTVINDVSNALVFRAYESLNKPQEVTRIKHEKELKESLNSIMTKIYHSIDLEPEDIVNALTGKEKVNPQYLAELEMLVKLAKGKSIDEIINGPEAKDIGADLIEILIEAKHMLEAMKLKESKMSKVTNFYKSKLNEGTWAIPKTASKAKKLINIIKNSMGKSSKDLKDNLYNIFGDDELFDELDAADYEFGPTNEFVIKTHLKRFLRKYPEYFSKEAKLILDNYLNGVDESLNESKGDFFLEGDTHIIYFKDKDKNIIKRVVLRNSDKDDVKVVFNNYLKIYPEIEYAEVTEKDGNQYKINKLELLKEGYPDSVTDNLVDKYSLSYYPAKHNRIKSEIINLTGNADIAQDVVDRLRVNYKKLNESVSPTIKKKADVRIIEIINQFKESLDDVMKELNPNDIDPTARDPFTDKPLYLTDTEIEVEEKIDTDYFWDKLHKESEKENIYFSVLENEGKYDGSTLYYIGLKTLNRDVDESLTENIRQKDGYTIYNDVTYKWKDDTSSDMEYQSFVSGLKDNLMEITSENLQYFALQFYVQPDGLELEVDYQDPEIRLGKNDYPFEDVFTGDVLEYIEEEDRKFFDSVNKQMKEELNDVEKNILPRVAREWGFRKQR